jgi:L-iditol 2-dehydrogenase
LIGIFDQHQPRIQRPSTWLSRHLSFLENRHFRHGLLSSFRFVAPYQAVPLPDGFSSAAATLIEPLACVLRSIGRGNVASGDPVVVVGNGTLGLLHAAALEVIGAAVILLDANGSPEAAVERVVSETKGSGAVSAFCTQGGAPWIEAAVKMSARGGRVLLFQSIRDQSKICFDANDIHYREVAILGTISQRLDDFRKAISVANLHPEIFNRIRVQPASYEQPAKAFEMSL